MSEDEILDEIGEENKEVAEGKPFEWWRKYSGMPVMLQLRPPLKFILVTAPNEPIEHTNTREEAIAVQGHPFLAVPIINGILEVEGVSDMDFRLVVMMSDPNPNKKALLRVVVHPEDALFVTVVEQSLIHQQ